MRIKRALVTGAGGFIGNHLVTFLKKKGYWVRGVDIKRPEFSDTDADEFKILDLRKLENCIVVQEGMNKAYHLAAKVGGIAYTSKNHAEVVRSNSLIDLNMFEAARIKRIDKFLYTSSACVYPQNLQKTRNVAPLKEDDAIPADPDSGYGWEKLFGEQIANYYGQDFGIKTSVARLHNVFGPLCTFQGGREKAPAAICRKVALAKEGGEIEIFGDGKQTRSFLYIDDCLDGIYRLMQSNYHQPLNLGQDRPVTIDGLVDIICKIANKRLVKRYNLSKPQGVRGRNSDNTRLKHILSWEPGVSLEEGLAQTYSWIKQQLK